jgi:hypothetical protein
VKVTTARNLFGACAFFAQLWLILLLFLQRQAGGYTSDESSTLFAIIIPPISSICIFAARYWNATMHETVGADDFQPTLNRVPFFAHLTLLIIYGVFLTYLITSYGQQRTSPNDFAELRTWIGGCQVIYYGIIANFVYVLYAQEGKPKK